MVPSDAIRSGHGKYPGCSTRNIALFQDFIARPTADAMKRRKQVFLEVPWCKGVTSVPQFQDSVSLHVAARSETHCNEKEASSMDPNLHRRTGPPVLHLEKTSKVQRWQGGQTPTFPGSLTPWAVFTPRRAAEKIIKKKGRAPRLPGNI
jgi:hypothetical protein